MFIISTFGLCDILSLGFILSFVISFFCPVYVDVPVASYLISLKDIRKEAGLWYIVAIQ